MKPLIFYLAGIALILIASIIVIALFFHQDEKSHKIIVMVFLIVGSVLIVLGDTYQKK
jgi:uncharacterized membrane protein